MAALCATAFTVNAQTKGTNTISVGFGSSKSERTYDNGSGSTSESTQKYNSVTLGYGLFFKDNEKIAVNLSYGSNKQESDPDFEQYMKTYGGSISYQKYYPIVNKLYAYAGGQVGYSFGEQTNSMNNVVSYEQNDYTVSAIGGISWFASKRFAFETNILSASMGYFSTKHRSQSAPNNVIEEVKSSSFGFNSSGAFNDLGFKIYLLF